jgi:alpha-ketoglutarate-dependent taurine dioxygenase
MSYAIRELSPLMGSEMAIDPAVLVGGSHGTALRVVRTLESSQRSVFPSPTDAQVAGWRMDWTTQPRFGYPHEWTVGDMLSWDNTGVLHRVRWYDLDSGRMMHRTTLVGEEALA